MQQRLFGIILKKLFPHVERRLGTRDALKKRRYVYHGVQWMKVIPVDHFGDVLKCVQEYVGDEGGISSSSTEVVVELSAGLMVNRSGVKKRVTFRDDFTWSLAVLNTVVDPEYILPSLTEHYKCFAVTGILTLVASLTICEGKAMPKVARISQLTVETVSSSSDGKAVMKARGKKCKKVLSLLGTGTMCRKCQNVEVQVQQTINHTTEQDSPTISLSTEDNKDMEQLMQLVLPGASEELKVLIQSQRSALLSPDKRQVRWDKDLLRLCLSLYSRCPAAYHELSSSGFLRLPSGRLLSYYKNTVDQKPGLNHEVFDWMLKEANRLAIAGDQRCGGLLIDEMRIQPGLQVSKEGSTFKLTGFTSLGEECKSIAALKTGCSQELANYVLQVSFLGFNGFRFPIAHFPTKQASCTDLQAIVWETVSRLTSFGFETLYINLDGAIQNRQFLKINFPDIDPCTNFYLCKHPLARFQKMAFIMDYSHTAKKIRNSLVGSCTGEKPLRTLQNEHGDLILWSHWRKCYEWDCSNTIPLHQKLTESHMEPSATDKMRNHLAEEVLNAEMLYVFQMFVEAQPENERSLYSFTKDFLCKTSLLIKIFRDKRPVCSLDDARLDQLKNVWGFFKTWESKSRKEKHLMTRETREDLDSTIMGFVGLVRLVKQLRPSISIVPAGINSDAIENHFCQQRGLYYQ